MLAAVVFVAAGAVLMSGGGVAAARPNASEVPTIADPDGEIFMKVHATPAQIAAVRTRVLHSKLVRRFAFLSKQDAMREFRKIYGDNERLMAQTSAEMLPTSFVLTFAKGVKATAIKHSFEGGRGVDEVRSRRNNGLSDDDRDRFERGCAFLRRNPDAGDVEIFMTVGASAAQTDAVRDSLAQNPDVKSFTSVSHRAALREFRKTFADKPKLLRGMTSADLPTSFRVRLTRGGDDVFLGVVPQGSPTDLFIDAANALPGVDESRVQLRPVDCAFYLNLSA